MTIEKVHELEAVALEEPSQNLAPARAALLRQRVLERVKSEPVATRAELKLQQLAVAVGVGALSLVVFFAWGGVRVGPRPFVLMLLTASGAAAIALSAFLMAWQRGRSMLGRPRRWLLLLTLATPLALLVWKLAVSAQFPEMMQRWAERPGVRCLELSLLVSLGPLVGVLCLRRGTDSLQPRVTGAALASAVAASTWVLVDLFCPVAYVPHLFLGHVLPFVVTLALGAFLGGRLLAVRKR